MKATSIKFYEFGEPQQVLKIENKQVKDPGVGEVLVRMKTRPINPSDLIPIKGAYSNRISLPAIPGYEGVGIVEEVGPSVSKWFLGKRVLPLRGEGTWQEFVKTSAELAIIVPDYLEDYIAAQLYINPITAWVICTEILALKPGDNLIVNACGSSIGRIFAQLSRILGFRLIAVTRNNIYTEELTQLGASYVINTEMTPLYDTVMELTNGRGAKAAIDSIGGSAGTNLSYCVSLNGVFLTIGLLSGIPVNWTEIMNNNKINTNIFHLRHWNQKVSTRKWHETFYQLIQFVHEKQLILTKPQVQYHLSDVKKALTTKIKGKILLTS
ncbi:zinc-dependent alcohol dehydrogenase family protein (plasmid) [Priestia megaterium]|uniref:Zinc-binding dehydrogenase family protein n=2 Tax=Bacillaceae TaxID=186817 RepID=A0A0B6AY13_PRIM2|nr:zinc-dependent alcohol dehydrogenase family protein [Priestia megaterium]AJI25603.1 zinc-binding dehydrogenase family protein [Priestia megaterium NBRC 15308 = ATCC 14581]KFM95456.1 zinc-binding dehydrogenase family protein [Priestia megaterium]KGJ81177.1 alcohol dehydrogenase [Priestia megaterium NBRC 15308 = ATCC 14581]MBU8756899.1 zinc-dependent alcohol dehydrogenase family protein [Priestia megaterium]MDR4229841.1 zinc-dependent alcohol dehydrogenase family protein [Priestia megaterium]